MSLLNPKSRKILNIALDKLHLAIEETIHIPRQRRIAPIQTTCLTPMNPIVVSRLPTLRPNCELNITIVLRLRCYRQRGIISFIIVRTAAILAGLDPLPIRPTNDFSICILGVDSEMV